jgi:hypothetical protein
MSAARWSLIAAIATMVVWGLKPAFAPATASVTWR